MTITRVGHPLRGRRLRVDRAAGQHRRDHRVVVFLPDSSKTLIPIEWTDTRAKDATATDAATCRFTAAGLRHLIRLLDAMAPGDKTPERPA